MIAIRRSDQRGYVDGDFVQSYHSFSFGSFYDPSNMQFRSLRVVNEERVAPGQGFDTHDHQNMEILSYVLDGELMQTDSIVAFPGAESTSAESTSAESMLAGGDFHCLSSGTGIRHSEKNPSATHSLHFYQFWIYPSEQNLMPGSARKRFDDRVSNQFRLVASNDGADGSLVIHQDVRVYVLNQQSGDKVQWSIPAGRHAYVQVIAGIVRINGQPLTTGDAAAISLETDLDVTCEESAEVLLFDLA